MPRGRLLVSHSTDEGSDERADLMRLLAPLRADYDILLDREALEAGGNWRPTIREWIRACDAAIVLVTPGSIASPFCQYEWSILSFRRTLHERFLILPIFLGSDPAHIQGSPHQISEISGYFGFGDVANIIPQVKARLDSEPFQQRQRFQTTLITESLTVSDRALDVAATNNGLDLGDWDFESDKRLQFATRIMSVGLDEAFGALQDVRRLLGQANLDKFCTIVEVVGRCAWVDMSAAQRIRACAPAAAAAERLFGLNANKDETAKSYVLTGSDKHPDDIWPVGAVLDDLSGEDHLHKRVRSELIGLLNLSDEVSDATLKQTLDAQLRKRPFFIVLNSKALTADWLGRLHGNELFAKVTFLVLTGEKITPGLLPETAVLTPVLPAGLEARVWDEYKETKRLLKLA